MSLTQPIMQQRLGSPKLSSYPQAIPTPKRTRVLHKSSSTVKQPIPVSKKSAKVSQNGFSVKPDLSIFTSNEKITGKRPPTAQSPTSTRHNQSVMSKSNLMQTTRSHANFSPLKGSMAASARHQNLTSELIEIESLKATVKALEVELAAKRDSEKQIEQLQRQLEVANTSNDKLVKSMGEMERQHALALQHLMQEHSLTVKHLREESRELNAQIMETHKDRVKIQKELKIAGNYIQELEERTLESNKTSLRLLKQVRDLEVECQALKNYIIDLKARVAVYVPVKGDPIDQKMAEFINNYPDRNKLKVLFMRDGEGVYEFGSKRVNVRVEKNKIQIRVGGGYLSIDEFLDQFTPVELEKLERRDPLKRFSEKVAISKSIQGHQVLMSPRRI